MESIDQQKAQQVWQRVRGNNNAGITSDLLTAFIVRETADGMACTRLAKRMGGWGGTLLQISRVCQQNAGCLRGIYTILAEKPPVLAVPPLCDDPPHIALKKCYVNLSIRVREYERYAQDPDHGPVFRKMVDATREQCATVLHLIGNLNV